MIRAEANQKFTIKQCSKLKIIQKKSTTANEFEKGDIFECDEKTAEYLNGKNELKRKVINILEVIKEPEKEEPKEQISKKKKIDKKAK